MIELDASKPFVTKVLDASWGDAKALQAAADLLHEIEVKTGVTAHYSVEDFFPDTNDREWCRTVFRDFLDATHVVVAAGDILTMVDFVRLDGTCECFSWRHWGGELADWANASWMPRPAVGSESGRDTSDTRWECMDFYMRPYLAPLVENYDSWADSLLEVVKLKSQQYPPRIVSG